MSNSILISAGSIIGGERADILIKDGVIVEIVGADAAPAGVATVLPVAAPLTVFTARI